MSAVPRPVENSVVSQVTRGRTSLDVEALRASGGGRRRSTRAVRRAERKGKQRGSAVQGDAA